MSVTMESVSVDVVFPSATENRAPRLGDRCFLVASLCLVLASPTRQWWASAGVRGEGKVRHLSFITLAISICGVFCLCCENVELFLLLGET